MRRGCATLLVIAACSHHRDDVAHQDLDRALDCALAHVVTDDRNAVEPVLDVFKYEIDRELAARALGRLIAAADAPGVRAGSRGAVLSLAAVLLDETGRAREAGTAAERAVAAVRDDANVTPGDRQYVRSNAAKAIAWSGDVAAAELVAADDPVVRIAAAEGAARGGDAASARRILATVPVPPATDDSSHVRVAMMIQANAWAGERDAVQRELAAEAPGWHLWNAALLAHAASDAAQPDAPAMIASAVAESERLFEPFGGAGGRAQVPAVDASGLTLADAARTAAIDLAELLARRGDRAAAAALRERIRKASEGRWTVLDALATRSAMAGDFAAADAVLAGLGEHATPETKLTIAILRGDFSDAIDALSIEPRPPSAALSRTSTVVDGRSIYEVLLWAKLVARASPERDIAARLVAAVCR